MKEVAGYKSNVGYLKPKWVRTTSMHSGAECQSAMVRRVSLQSYVVIDVGEDR